MSDTEKFIIELIASGLNLNVAVKQLDRQLSPLPAAIEALEALSDDELWALVQCGALKDLANARAAFARYHNMLREMWQKLGRLHDAASRRRDKQQQED